MEISSMQANTTPLAAIGQQQTQSPGQTDGQAQEQEDLSSKYDKKLAELTSKFDGLSRRERMLLQKEREIQEKSSHVEQYENLKELAKKSPAQLLEKFGITYDQLTDYYASQTPEDETSRTVGSLKQELAELKKQMEVQKTEGQAREIAKVREQKLEALKNLANKDDSPYGLISQFGSYEDVLIYMGQHYQATGEILDDQTAMEAVEKQLEENLKVLAKSNKVRKLLGFDQAISSPEVQSHKSITLSNNFGSEAPRTQDTRGLSEAQLFELALQQMPDLK
jgi:Zn-dependent M32 family carboxypeptidase